MVVCMSNKYTSSAQFHLRGYGQLYLYWEFSPQQQGTTLIKFGETAKLLDVISHINLDWLSQK